MRIAHTHFLLLASLVTGCVGTPIPDTDRTATDAPQPGSFATASQTDSGPPKTNSTNQQTTISGQVTGELKYRMSSLGPASAGQRWTLRPNGALTSAFVVALFDQDNNLLQRTFMSTGTRLEHVLRESVRDLQIGVMVPIGRRGGRFDFSIDIEDNVRIPAPRKQVVWLNFGSADGVQIHTRAAVSFRAFDATMVNADYAGQTAVMRDAIFETVQADYANYNVELLRSDVDPRPAVEHSVIHFGGSSSGLLGLADSVDSYNESLSQQAIIYVESFAPYRTMRLSPVEMGVMIGNVASHELGHLLGLFHTASPNDVMDTTGSAWDLAGAQGFSRAPLEQTVFATGMEDGPRLLDQIVGPGSGPKTAGLLKVAPEVFAQIRPIAHMEIPYTCGTCCAASEGTE